MFNRFWSLVASFAMSDRGFRWLHKRADKSHYTHILHMGKLYMWRGWVIKRWRNFPAVRLHRIMGPDLSRDMHSHPFNFRTIILRGWYIQEYPGEHWPGQKNSINVVKMLPGMQSICKYGDFHRITQVSQGGCWTLFIMWGGKRHDWGFMTKNGFVHARDYKDKNGHGVAKV